MTWSQMSFVETSEAIGIDFFYLGLNENGGGAAFFDFDGDNDEDLWIVGGLNMDALYKNDGTGNFTNIAPEADLGITTNYVTTGVSTGDLDNDGWIDVVLSTHRGVSPRILRNQGDGTFQDITPITGLEEYQSYSTSVILADANLDGLLDIYSTNYIEEEELVYNESQDSIIGYAHTGQANHLFINLGDLHFMESASAYGLADKGCGLAASFTDYDQDNDQDLLIANDFGAWVLPNSLLENEGLIFEEVGKITGTNQGIYAMGIAVGDYDNDLDLDYYITNIGANLLLENLDHQFIELAEQRGVDNIENEDRLFTVGWGAAFSDFDNDTDLDLYVVNGYVPTAPFLANSTDNRNVLFENDGTGQFNQVENQPQVESSKRGRGLAYADFDRDGDLDFVVINQNQNSNLNNKHLVEVYRNTSDTSPHWLQVELQGVISNRPAYGSQIIINVGNEQYLREYTGGFGSHASQHSVVAHFGLGSVDTVNNIQVRWPSGQVRDYGPIQADHRIKLIEDEDEILYVPDPVIDTMVMDTTGMNDTTIVQLVEEEFLKYFKVYPNPVKDLLFVEFDINSSETIQLKIIDLLGRVIYLRQHTNPSTGKVLIQVPAPEPGIYFIQCKTSEFKISQCFISN